MSNFTILRRLSDGTIKIRFDDGTTKRVRNADLAELEAATSAVSEPVFEEDLVEDSDFDLDVEDEEYLDEEDLNL